MGRPVPVVAESPDDDAPTLAAQAALAHVPLTVAAVAARLGVAPSTLRTWDRRYGLGPSGRSAGSHRRYTADDVARLETMRRLTLSGAAPSDAARMAARSVAGAVPTLPFAAQVPEQAGAAPKVDALTFAAAAIDGDELRVKRVLGAAVRGWGLVGAWSEVVQPALGFLSRRAMADRPGRDPEHLLAGAVLAVTRGAAEAVASARRGVVICTDPSLVTDRLGAHVLAGALAERGVSAAVRMCPVDADGALRAVEGPGHVVLAVVGNPPEGEALARAAGERDGVLVILVGPEAPAVWLPEVQRVRTYAGAVHEIVGALSSAARAPDPAPQEVQHPS